MRTRIAITCVAAIICPLLLLSQISTTGASKPLFTQFAQLIRTNDLIALRTLAATPGTVDVVDNLKNTPLHYAVTYGSAEAVRILLQAGADPKACNQAGATPLLYAAWNLAKTQLLVEKGADVNVAQNDGVTPLMVAVSAHSNNDTARFLLAKGANVNALDGFRNDALMRAAGMSDEESLRLLLSRGANAHNLNRHGFGALSNAIAFPDSERIQLLLAAGSEPNQTNTNGGMVKKGPIALVHLTPLILAAPYSDEATVSTLLKAGARVNDVDIRKMNPLMLSIATDQANSATVRQLITAGANVNAKDGTGEAVLTWARKYRNPQILSALGDAGAEGSELLPAPQLAPGTEPASAAEAIRRSLPQMTRSGNQFFQESGCVGCHHQAIHARAFAAAARAHLNPDPMLRRNFLDAMLTARPLLYSSLPVLSSPPGDYDTLLNFMISYADLGEPANELTDLMLHYIAVRQDPSGGWINLGIARAPIEDSSITRTAMAIRTLGRYGWPARQTEFAQRIDRARLWLQSAKALTTYEQAEKLLGLQAAGIPISELQNEAAELRKLQHSDGGWAQTPFLESDAYATGLVLHALFTTGLASPSDAVYRSGVDFLLRTQFPDGSWFVRSRAPKFQPYFESGFPFHHDQWISSMATSLAVMALAPAAAAEPIAERKLNH